MRWSHGRGGTTRCGAVRTVTTGADGGQGSVPLTLRVLCGPWAEGVSVCLLADSGRTVVGLFPPGSGRQRALDCSPARALSFVSAPSARSGPPAPATGPAVRSVPGKAWAEAPPEQACIPGLRSPPATMGEALAGLPDTLSLLHYCGPLGSSAMMKGHRAHAQNAGIVTCGRGSRGGPRPRPGRGSAGEPASARGCGGASGQPGRAGSPARMEVLDEFDSAFPQSVTFCQLISEEDFERQAATYTDRALRRLFRSLDRNPALAERVVRKGKQAELERRGLASFLWAKFFSAVQGDLNHCNSMGALEMHQRLEKLKRSIHRVHLYSRDAKKRRRKLKLKKPEPILLRDQSTSLCPPPTLLPPPPLLPSPPATTKASLVAPSPPVYTMPRVFGPFPPLPSKSVENLETARSEGKLNWNGLSPNPKSCMIDLTPLVLNPGGFHFLYLAGNSARKLHCPTFPWNSACSSSPNTDETPAPAVNSSVFSPPVLLKFHPAPRPKDDSENDPGSTESVTHKRSP
ncbi:uncharacterized protein LOC123626222 [Lemur catta]|uniref:uncharacterized protein LOC123626222 n=1 Tax=Lemur catta TaxID=9447 RepID=UPI001E26D0D5|nr:uncharacterized protein LOC123626222 [Lemur catta]